jgi:hypothetical protein
MLAWPDPSPAGNTRQGYTGIKREALSGQGAIAVRKGIASVQILFFSTISLNWQVQFLKPVLVFSRRRRIFKPNLLNLKD